METIQVILTRRSIRKYRTDPVRDEDLATVLEAARRAPSWKNSQCWRFIIVRDPEIKNRLAETLPPANRGAAAIKQAPLLIVACAELGKAGYGTEGAQTDKGDWFMFDVALAMENLVLAAHALGLGTVYIGLFDAPKAEAILDVPKGFRVVAMTPLGYPDEAPDARPRKELKEIVFRDRFGLPEHR